MTADLLSGYRDRTLEGVYPLGNLLGSSAHSAVYETEHGEMARPALIELRRGDTPDAARRLSRWRKALDFSHPNLLRLYSAGSSVIDGAPVIYLVTERPDESLAVVLAGRALTEDETREMLEPALSALSYLNKKGYAHTNLEPSNVLAVGESLKLASDGIEPVNEGGVPADDMRALGILLVQVLTRRVPAPGNSGSYDEREIPESLMPIVRHCLDPDPERRWTAQQALGHLQGRGEEVSGGDARGEAGSRSFNPLPLQETHPERGHDSRKWIFAALAAVLVIAAAWAFMSRAHWVPATEVPASQNAPAEAPRAETAPAEVASAPAPAPPVARAEVAPAPRTVAPETRSEVPQPAAAPPLSRNRKADGWAVVVATYGARGPAEKRARDLGAKWPKFQANVFEAPSENAHHLVVLGSNLSEERAEALRKRALAAGLPRDTYIKRIAAQHE